MNGLTKIAVVVIVTGVLLMVGPAYGFSTVSVDRGVYVGSADDPDGLLGILDNSDEATIDRSGDDNELFFLNDNIDAFTVSDLDATVVDFPDGNDDDLSADVEPTVEGYDFAVTVSCDGDAHHPQGSDLTLEITAIGDLSVTLERTAEDVSVNCRGGGPPNSPPGGTGVVVEDGAQSNDEIETDGDVWIGENAQTNDEVEAGGDIYFNDNSRSNEEVEAGGDIIAGDNYHSNGELSTGGDLLVGDGVRFNDEVDADGDVTIGDDGNLNGELEAEGDVQIGNDAQLNDELEVEGDLSIGDNGIVNGEVTVGGDLTIGNSVRFNDEVTVDGSIYVGCDVVFNGEVEADDVEEEC